MDRLFVYGSLKQGTAFHSEYLSHSKKENKALIAGFEMYDSNKGYPYLIRGGKQISCESYLIPEKTLRQIDDFEEHPDYYRRELINSSDGRPGWIYIYQYSCKKLKEIPEGIWPV